MDAVEFIPLKDFSARYADGWRLISPLAPTDYAALMRAPVEPKSNKYCAAVSRNCKPKTGTSELEQAIRAFRLPERRAKILVLLMHRGIASHDTISTLVYDDDERVEIEYLEGAIRDHMKRLRKRLAVHGIEITTAYGYGYEMSEEMRARTRLHMAAINA